MIQYYRNLLYISILFPFIKKKSFKSIEKSLHYLHIIWYIEKLLRINNVIINFHIRIFVFTVISKSKSITITIPLQLHLLHFTFLVSPFPVCHFLLPFFPLFQSLVSSTLSSSVKSDSSFQLSNLLSS